MAEPGVQRVGFRRVPSTRVVLTITLGGLALSWCPAEEPIRPDANARPTALAARTVVTLTLPDKAADPVSAALRAIADCRATFEGVRDYTCTFHKRERVDDHLSGRHVMEMKARTQPYSVYFRFEKPAKGREAIYVSGHHGDRVLVHDIGFVKLLTGTLALDPEGGRAMQECRHPITESGLGHLIETVSDRWAVELSNPECRVTIDSHARSGGRPGTLIEAIHPRRQADFFFHKVRLFIDDEHHLPTRIESYDWPSRPGAPAELVEEYVYQDLKLNVGLKDGDFDPANKSYAFGRF